ncbi:MAG TPA: ABC transporter permease, partial [Bacteroidota bacterium]|nr:ABC transporter permease [Bacteroidota bacterium]
MNVTSSQSSFFLASLTLCRRELVRFYRQRTRVVGVIGSPLVFWFLIGSGLGTSFHHPNAPPEMNYLEYFFPGTIVLIILFTAIFSTISIIEDRKEGFLQSVIVAPVSRASIALGKILGSTALAMIQAIILLALTPLIGISLDITSFLVVLVALLVVSFGLSGLGFLIAWRMDSTQAFHAIMNLFLIPLWLLSGALFP